MQVIMHKAADGALFEKFEDFAAHQSKLKVKEAVAAVSLDTGLFFVNEDAGSHTKVLAEDDLSEFIAVNADALRKVLESSKVVKRGRKSSKQATQAAA